MNVVVTDSSEAQEGRPLQRKGIPLRITKLASAAALVFILSKRHAKACRAHKGLILSDVNRTAIGGIKGNFTGFEPKKEHFRHSRPRQSLSPLTPNTAFVLPDTAVGFSLAQRHQILCAREGAGNCSKEKPNSGFAFWVPLYKILLFLPQSL